MPFAPPAATRSRGCGRAARCAGSAPAARSTAPRSSSASPATSTTPSRAAASRWRRTCSVTPPGRRRSRARSRSGRVPRSARSTAATSWRSPSTPVRAGAPGSTRWSSRCVPAASPRCPPRGSCAAARPTAPNVAGVDSFSRRTLLRRGALAGAALAGAGGAADLLAAAPPLPRLQRGVALGPFFAFHSDQRYESNRARFDDTGTPWVRLWADWPQLQPEAARAPDAGTGARVVAALDAQVDRARADGRRVMLTAWRFAPWANGTASLSDADDVRFRLADRLRRGADPAARKSLTYRLPGDLSPSGAWGRWIAWLLARYAGRIDALEIVNEPNLQLWPQRDAAGALTIDAAVATMMQTAAALASREKRAPMLVAPATGDPVGDSRLRTGYHTFTRALLDRLAERRFEPGPRFAWSHHNYTDVESLLAGADNRVARVRAMLTGRWTGWPRGDGRAPGILVTESGARPEVVAARFGLRDRAAALRGQAEALRHNASLMTLAPEGAGVGMLCQYLFVTDVFYDSGLCELDGAARPAYYAWA